MKEFAILYPDLAGSTYLNIAMAYFDLGRHNEGIEYTLMVVEIDYFMAYSYISTAAYILFESNQKDKGNKLLELGAKIDPTNQFAYRQTMQ